MIGEFTRGCPGDRRGRVHPFPRVIECSRATHRSGAPRYLRSDNGPELVSRAILEWLADQKIDTAINDPGKPWQNGTDESFNEWFRSCSPHPAMVN